METWVAQAFLNHLRMGLVMIKRLVRTLIHTILPFSRWVREKSFMPQVSTTKLHLKRSIDANWLNSRAFHSKMDLTPRNNLLHTERTSNPSKILKSTKWAPHSGLLRKIRNKSFRRCSREKKSYVDITIRCRRCNLSSHRMTSKAASTLQRFHKLSNIPSQRHSCMKRILRFN